MGGFVQSIGKFFNSTPGRVLTGIATAGTSEIVREGVTLTAHNTKLEPQVAGIVGETLGATAGVPLGAGTGPSMPVAGPKGAGANPLAVASGAAKGAAPSLDLAMPVTTPVLGTPITPPVASRPQTPEEEMASRRRAIEAQRRLGNYSTRASDQLTHTGSLG